MVDVAHEEEKELERQISNKEELPTSIIIRNVPKELFDDPEMKSNFADMFVQIEPSGFQRVRVVFTKPEHATAAKMTVEHHSFQGSNMKAYFAQNIKMIRKAYQDEQGHLKLPPLEKQFLISPPCSPPVGWVQQSEMAPIVCDFDLMARLAAFTVEDNYELHGGENGQPAIIVTPAGGRDRDQTPAEMPEVDPSKIENIEDVEVEELMEGGPRGSPIGKVALPHTPRPPLKEQS
ncbi:calcipressin domain-containing protein [Ditylenchus destructor]|nr:calcipressin domain-containing protein [Ditylenchus destructor]